QHVPGDGSGEVLLTEVSGPAASIRELRAAGAGRADGRVVTAGPRSRSRPRVPLWLVATALCTIPLIKLIRDTFTGGLGVDPVIELIHRTGWWALTLLVITLAV